jgi:hypothetical protein
MGFCISAMSYTFLQLQKRPIMHLISNDFSKTLKAEKILSNFPTVRMTCNAFVFKLLA